MYCDICNTPILVPSMKPLPLGKDAAEGLSYCPYCRRVYRVTLTVLKETDWTPEQISERRKSEGKR